MDWFNIIKGRSTRKEDVIARAKNTPTKRIEHTIFLKQKTHGLLTSNPADKEYITIIHKLKQKREIFLANSKISIKVNKFASNIQRMV